MRADADLMVYVAARWPTLVREAVLLGVPPDQAADTVTEALVRCRRDWRRASSEENVDALVDDELARAASRRATSPQETREEAARELLVLAPPTVQDLERRQRESSRATLSKAAKVALPLVLVAAGAGVYFASRDDTKEPPPRSHPNIGKAAVARQENPAPGVVWYADGQLHLEHSVVAVEGLTNMTRLGAGVVYGDDHGRVVYLQDDGSREVLGHTDPSAAVAATDDTFWAAWVDTRTGKLVVEQAGSGDLVGTADVGPGARVIAVDGNQVYFVDTSGQHVYTPGTDPQLRPYLPGDLLDVRAQMTAFQGDRATIKVSPSFYSVVHDLPGQGAQLSPDGKLVASRLPDGEVALYDTTSGRRLVSGLGGHDDVVAFAPGRDFTIDYVVAPGTSTPAHELQLRTCQLRTKTCRTAAGIPNTGGIPVLAR